MWYFFSREKNLVHYFSGFQLFVAKTWQKKPPVKKRVIFSKFDRRGGHFFKILGHRTPNTPVLPRLIRGSCSCPSMTDI